MGPLNMSPEKSRGHSLYQDCEIHICLGSLGTFEKLPGFYFLYAKNTAGIAVLKLDSLNSVGMKESWGTLRLTQAQTPLFI